MDADVMWPLQWSRPQLRTETLFSRMCCTMRLRASMEPSSVEDGNLATVGTCITGSTFASMEPSSVEDGNLSDVEQHVPVNVVASMEPSSVEDGNSERTKGWNTGGA